FFLRTGTGLDDVASLDLNSLFKMVSEMTGEVASENAVLSGIFGFGQTNDFGILSCHDQNVRLYLLFEGASTDQLPTFRDHFFRSACLALFETFRERIPVECSGSHHSEDDTISDIVANAIPTHDLVGVTHLVPTHSLKFPIQRGGGFSHEIHQYNCLGDGFHHSDLGQIIERSINNLVARQTDICAFWDGLTGRFSEFMTLKPYSIAFFFGPSFITDPDPKLYPRYVCIADAHPLSLHFTFGVPMMPSIAATIDGLASIAEMRRRF
ncbi:MAG: hypothetical protein ACFFB3_02505, partial [Candidatus Hodarchaeota archaeon]